MRNRKRTRFGKNVPETKRKQRIKELKKRIRVRLSSMLPFVIQASFVQLNYPWEGHK
jgi:hypothetical protein